MLIDLDPDHLEITRRISTQMVKAAGLAHCISPVEGEDANDWYVRAGLFPVSAAMMRLRCAAPP